MVALQSMKGAARGVPCSKQLPSAVQAPPQPALHDAPHKGLPHNKVVAVCCRMPLLCTRHQRLTQRRKLGPLPIRDRCQNVVNVLCAASLNMSRAG